MHLEGGAKSENFCPPIGENWSPKFPPYELIFFSFLLNIFCKQNKIALKWVRENQQDFSDGPAVGEMERM